VIRVLVLVFVGLSAVDPGCGLDGGDDGGAADTGPAQTVGTQCTAVITEFCAQYPRCALDDSISDCVANNMPACCSTGDTCDQVSTSTEGDVATCKTDIDNLDCNFIANMALAPSCQGLVHP
jgi:hypothetical protein